MTTTTRTIALAPAMLDTLLQFDRDAEAIRLLIAANDAELENQRWTHIDAVNAAATKGH